MGWVPHFAPVRYNWDSYVAANMRNFHSAFGADVTSTRRGGSTFCEGYSR
jgi:hypothetical protein